LKIYKQIRLYINNLSKYQKLAFIIGIIITIILFCYARFILLFPLLASFLVFWFGRKYLIGRQKIFIYTIALQGGYIIWLLANVILLTQWNILIFLILLLAGVLTYLLRYANKISIIIVMVFYLLELISKIVNLFHTGFKDNLAKIISVRIILCIAILYTSYYAYNKWNEYLKMIEQRIKTKAKKLKEAEESEIIILSTEDEFTG